MFDKITDALIDQLVQAISEAVARRPELARFREPIQSALEGNAFQHLTRRAFETFAQRTDAALPEHFDAGFLAMPRVQALLAAHIVEGQAADAEALAELFAQRHLKPAAAPDVRPQLMEYLAQLRETFAADPFYGPVLLSRDVQSIIAALQNLRGELHGFRGEMHARFDAVMERFDALLKDPEVKALAERRTGSHIFLSYSRRNLAPALRIRNALEDAGHTVWQDTTAIKGGEAWIQSIEDGIERAYAMVSVVSHEAQHSKWVRIEYLHAERREKLIVPIRIDGCEIPMMMLDRNVVPAHPDLEAGLRQLLAALPPRSAPGQPPQEEARPVVTSSLDWERAYLDRMLLEYSVWQTVYTPMAGVGQMEVDSEAESKLEVVTTATEIEASFSAFLEEALEESEAREIHRERRDYDDILAAVGDMRQVVILGDPGSGKTTTLWRIAFDAASRARADQTLPLPVFLRLGELNAGQTVDSLVEAQLGAHFERLLDERRLLLLLDGLNEMPEAGREANLGAIRALARRFAEAGMRLVVTCRELDYTGPLDLGLPNQILIAPLDPLRIRRFVSAYIVRPPGKGDELFWQIAGEAARGYWQRFVKYYKGEQYKREFWTLRRQNFSTYWHDWDSWVLEREHPRGLLRLASNPYMLFMITQVFTRTSRIPQNRGALFRTFIDFLLLRRERLDPAAASALRQRLAHLAYEMQRQGAGTGFTHEAALACLVDEHSLYQAQSANILAGSDTVRFSHQLLQEYFAAHRLEAMIKAGQPAAQLWPPESWWLPQGWEETAILLAGLYNDDCTPVIEWLRETNPVVAMRCVTESGAHTPPETITALRPLWLPRITDAGREPQAEARAEVARACGVLRLDSRPGVGCKDGLPAVRWRRVPPGRFRMGGDLTAYDAWEGAEIAVPYAYDIALYPVTCAQFEAFVESGGYAGDHHWTQAGLAWRRDRKHPQLGWMNPRTHIANYPVTGVTWHEAYAFCRWLSAALGEPIRLPTEAEWEYAARGPGGRLLGVYNPGLTAVGVWQDDESPFGAQDMGTLVGEWTLSKAQAAYQHPEDNDPEGGALRAIRGHTNMLAISGRLASTFYGAPGYRAETLGFRLCRSEGILSR